MNVLIIVSILCIIIWYCIYETEGFEGQPIDPKVEQKYQQFVGFYNPFLVNWEKAIVTMIGLDTPVKPLTSPDDVASATFQAPTRVEMNAYIKKLEKTSEKPLPFLTDPLPAMLTPTVLADVTQYITMDPSPYQNALEIMVNSQKEAHSQLDAMKKSPEGFDAINPYQYMEGFDSCQDYKKCMTDPEVIAAIAKAQSEQQQKEQSDRQNEFETKLDKFNSDKAIQGLTEQNKVYLQKAMEIQEQAKNGTLLNQFNLTNGDTSLDHFIKPQGIYKLANLKKDNPTQYAEYEKKNSQIMTVVGLLNSISNTLVSK